MISDSEYQDIMKNIGAKRNETVDTSLGPLPKSVEFLRICLDQAKDDADRRKLFPLLLSECSRSKNDVAYLHFLRRSANEMSDDPIAVSGAAYGIAIVDLSAKHEALALANQAVKLALAQDRLVKHSATNLIRIALLLDAYDYVSLGISALLNERGAIRAEDSSYQFDFLDKIDPDRVDRRMLDEYRALSK